MFKVLALLAVVGYASAGVSVRDAVALNNQIATQNAINLGGALQNGLLAGQIGSLPLTYSVAGVQNLGLGSVVGVPSVGLTTASVRDAVALQNQINTQNAINSQGAVRNAVLSGQVSSLPLTYSVAPSVALSSVSLRDAVALQNQINTQNAINSQGAVSVRDAVAQNNQIATQNAINSQGALQNAVLTRGAAIVATGEGVNAINDRINTQIAIQQGIVASQQGIVAGHQGIVAGQQGLLTRSVVGVPSLSLLSSGSVLSGLNSQGILSNGGLIYVQ